MTGTAFLRNACGLPRVLRLLGPALLRLVASPPERAARTPVSLAQDPEAAGTGGRFYGPELKERKVPARAKRPERRTGLWAASEELVRPYLTPVAHKTKGDTQ